MKKQLLYVFLSFIFIGVIYSCNQDEDVTSINPDRVARFLDSEEEIVIQEADGGVVLEVGVWVNYPKDEPVRVTYEVLDNSGGFEVLSEPGYAVVPAGEQAGVILIGVPEDDDIFTGDRTMTIRVTGSDSDFGEPYDLAPGLIEKTIVLVEDEITCEPADQEWNVFVGTLEFEDVGFGSGIPATGEFVNNNCDLLVTGNLPNSNAQINAPFVFQMTPSGNGDGLGTVQVDNQPYGNSGFTYQASGTYDLGAGSITVAYEFLQPSGSLQWDGTNIITIP